MLCKYGCGQPAITQLKDNTWICADSWAKCPVNKIKNSTGLKEAWKNGSISKSSGFTNEQRLKAKETIWKIIRSKPFEEIGYSARYTLLMEQQNNGCLICGITNWQNKSIRFHMDHINGDHTDNKRENLRLICPNCHSQTDTYCKSRRNKKINQVTDNDIITASKISTSVKQILLNVGLTPNGGNYERIYSVIISNKLKLAEKTKPIYDKKRKHTSSKHIKNKLTCICGKIIRNSLSNKCRKCYTISARKVERPSYETLMNEIKNSNYCAVGRKYGVSDNAIRKWIKYYEEGMDKLEKSTGLDPVEG